MRGDLIALDLETTGLDLQKDTIIEFGAVRIRDGQIIDSYQTLINPGRPIPPEITGLTGISDADFVPRPRTAGEPSPTPIPTIEQARGFITTFVGSAPVIAHNIEFDRGFLNKYHLCEANIWIDTLELAPVLLPHAPRYGLESLSHQLHIERNASHRALDDARAGAMLYWQLWEKGLQLPRAIIQEILNIGQVTGWNTTPFFEALLQEAVDRPAPAFLSLPPDAPASAQTPSAITSEAISDTLNQILGEQGRLATVDSSFEFRPQQLEMAQNIADALHNNQHLIIEAGTGVGKSLAYLIPAALWAQGHHERVVISTNTIQLQEQLINQEAVATAQLVGEPLRVALLKGRGNYLCPQRLTAIRRRQPTSIDEARVLAKLLVWLTEGGSGDRSDLTLRGPVEQSIWLRLSAEDEHCPTERCEALAGGTCPFHRARAAADNAHLLIVNHALLVSDATSDTPILPQYQQVIIDEAHHLEEAVTNSLSFRLDEQTLKRRLGELGTARRGLLGEIVSNLQTRVPPKKHERLVEIVKYISAATREMESHIESLFKKLLEVFRQAANGYDNSPQRVTDGLRKRAEFGLMRQAWQPLHEYFSVLGDTMTRFGDYLARQREYDIPNFDDMLNTVTASGRYFEDIRLQIHAFIDQPDNNTVYWLHPGYNGNLSLNTAPIHVGRMLQQYLWDTKRSVVLTGATLRTDGNFNYLAQRLQAEDIKTVALGSPFDYRQSTLLYIPNDTPDPNDRGHYQPAVERGVIELATALDGRTLALFTSYTHLQQTAQAIRDRLRLGNIVVYDQIDASNRQELLESFKSAQKAVLLGTRSFWEGVDIPGDALKAIVITKLPFPVPNDPIFSARSEGYTDAFKEYTLQETILRFRQGFGRLIRSHQDRGVVVILDRRLMTKSYGTNFLDSLPNCTVQYGSLSAMPEAARKWIDQR